MSEKQQHKVDVAPLLRGDVKYLKIPVISESGYNQITLTAVRTTRMIDNAGPKCVSCGYSQDYTYKGMNYCPGCGAKIINQ